MESELFKTMALPIEDGGWAAMWVFWFEGFRGGDVSWWWRGVVWCQDWVGWWRRSGGWVEGGGGICGSAGRLGWGHVVGGLGGVDLGKVTAGETLSIGMSTKGTRGPLLLLALWEDSGISGYILVLPAAMKQALTECMETGLETAVGTLELTRCAARELGRVSDKTWTE